MILSQDGQYTTGREARWEEGIGLILNLLKDSRKKDREIRVLDIGCGEGSVFKFLKRRIELEGLSLKNLSYYAIDANPELKTLLKDSGMIFHQGDFNKLDEIYEKDFFDVIIASEVLEHLTETDHFILSLKHILKDSGFIFLTTPNLASWHGRLMLLFGYQPLATEVSSIRAEFGKGNVLKGYYHGNAIMHIRVFTLPALKDFLEFHGFIIENVWGGGYRKLDSFVFAKWFKGFSPILKVMLRKKL